MQKARGHPKAPSACKRTVSGSISLPCSGYFSPFPHGTGSLSVIEQYLALPDGPGRFRQGFTCPALLRILLGIIIISHTGLSPSMVQLSRRFRYNYKVHIVVLQPHKCRNKYGLGYFPFARHYQGNHYCFLFLRLLRCFSSPGQPHRSGNWSSTSWVAPFGNPRLKGYLHLIVAYRSLSRPSSPLRAKASAIRPQ